MRIRDQVHKYLLDSQRNVGMQRRGPLFIANKRKKERKGRRNQGKDKKERNEKQRVERKKTE